MKLILSSLALGAAATPSAMNLMGDPETPSPVAPVAAVAPVEPVAPLATLLPVTSVAPVAPVAAAAPIATSLPARAPRPTVPVRLATLPQDDDLTKSAKELEQEIARLRERLGEMKRVVGEAKRGEVTRELRGRLVAPRATEIRAAAEGARAKADAARERADALRARAEELRASGLKNTHSRLIKVQRAHEDAQAQLEEARVRLFAVEDQHADLENARAHAEEARKQVEDAHQRFVRGRVITETLPQPPAVRRWVTGTAVAPGAAHGSHSGQASTINIHVEDGDVIIHAGGATVNTTSGKASQSKSKKDKDKGKDKKKSKSKKKDKKSDDAFGVWISDDEHGGNTFRWSSDDGDDAEGFAWVTGDDEDGAHIFQGMSGGDHVVFGSDGEAGLFFAGDDSDEDVRIIELPGGGEAKVMVRSFFSDGGVSEECDVEELLADAGGWIDGHKGNIVFMDALNGAQFGIDGDTFELDMDVDVDLNESSFVHVFEGLEGLEGLDSLEFLKEADGLKGKATINGRQFVFPGGNTDIDIETLLEGQGFDSILEGAGIDEGQTEVIVEALKAAGGGERTFSFPGGSGTIRVETSEGGDVSVEEVIESLGATSQGYFAVDSGDGDVDIQTLIESVKGKNGEAPKLRVRTLKGKAINTSPKTEKNVRVRVERNSEADTVLEALEGLGSNDVISGTLQPVRQRDAELVDMVREIRAEVQAMRAELAELREAVTAAPAKREGRPLRSTRR